MVRHSKGTTDDASLQLRGLSQTHVPLALPRLHFRHNGRFRCLHQLHKPTRVLEDFQIIILRSLAQNPLGALFLPSTSQHCGSAVHRPETFLIKMNGGKVKHGDIFLSGVEMEDPYTRTAKITPP